MRVVLDTNILISACWTPGGLEAQVLALALDGAITACVSPAVLAEYREVLGRKKFHSRQARITEILAVLEARAVLVEPMETLHLATDEDDNRFLECAVTAGAAYLITGNLRDFPASAGNTNIVSSRIFLNSWNPVFFTNTES